MVTRPRPDRIEAQLENLRGRKSGQNAIRKQCGLLDCKSAVRFVDAVAEAADQVAYLRMSGSALRSPRSRSGRVRLAG